MKIVFHQQSNQTIPITEDFAHFNLKDSIEKTQKALELAYLGFDNATDSDLIDSYIYEIISLQKRYEHLISLASTSQDVDDCTKLHQHTPIKTLISQVFS